MKKIIALLLCVVCVYAQVYTVEAAYRFDNFVGKSPLHAYAKTGSIPRGMAPAMIKVFYNLPKTGGDGKTIAIIGAYNHTTIEKDLSDFDTQFSLPVCTIQNHCLEKHLMSSNEKSDSNWTLETTLDVEWAHAIAPNAHILLVESTTPSGMNFLKAIDYVAKRTDVDAVSMSWGGAEFADESNLDTHFVGKSGAVFFASSGDSGAGVSWPAVSPNVIAVGGTSLTLNSQGGLQKETAWQGSGGGVSAYEQAPTYQQKYTIPKASGMRAIPDVAYDADPKSGFPIIHAGVWRTVGGTSAGAPQWAAIAVLGSGVNSQKLYLDKTSENPSRYFRDISSGSNGMCGYFCTARARYDYVTGLGSPVTVHF